MKHLGPSQAAYAAVMLEEIGVRLDTVDLERMLRHVDWLIETNQRLNLTAVSEPSAAVRLHLVDSLTALPEVHGAPAGLLVDLGTGGGFPGVELALADNREALLVDSVKKKCVALSGYLAQESLEPRISVSAVRAEELAQSRRELAAVVTARALSQLPSLVELASPLLAHGGLLVALKARPEESEVSRARATAARCGMTERTVRTFKLPGGEDQRTIITYEKTGPSGVELPRRIGLAQKQPLF